MLPALRGTSIHSVSVNFGVNIPLVDSEEVDAQFQEIQKTWPRRPIDLLGGDKSDGNMVMTHIHSRYTGDTEEQPRLYVDVESFTYPLEDDLPPTERRRLRRDLQKIDSFLATLNRFTNEIHFHCRLNWRFPLGSIISVIHLPLMQVPIPGTPYEQISGVRLTSSSPGDSEYAILDLEGQEQLHLTIVFQHNGFLSQPFVNTTIEKGEEIRKIIVDWKR